MFGWRFFRIWNINFWFLHLVLHFWKYWYFQNTKIPHKNRFFYLLKCSMYGTMNSLKLFSNIKIMLLLHIIQLASASGSSSKWRKSTINKGFPVTGWGEHRFYFNRSSKRYVTYSRFLPLSPEYAVVHAPTAEKRQIQIYRFVYLLYIRLRMDFCFILI